MRAAWRGVAGGVIAAVLVVATSCAGTATSPGATVFESPSLEDRVFALVNDRRAAGATCAGRAYAAVAPLSRDQALTSAARQHSRDMAAGNYFSHEDRQGQPFGQRISDAGFGGSQPWGENIAAGQATADAVVAGWMTMPDHCANIMSDSYASMGIGYAYGVDSKYRHYWTQDFGGR